MTEALPKLAGIVLAAGASERLGRPKQLVAHAGKPLLLHAVEQALAVCGAGVTVVTGANRAAVAAALTDSAVNVVHNPNWQSGMAGSLREGIKSVASSGCDAVLLMVCDQPAVTHAHLAALAALWQNAPSRPAAALYGGLTGVPAIVPRSFFSRLAALQGDQGARVLLRAAAADVQTLNLPEAATDIDTPDDLRQLGAGPDGL